jgi:methylated-DNA-[protein]-cysteine S-methyltransferase
MPWALTGADCRLRPVAVTGLRYGVEGWGVAELWVAGTRVASSELPRPASARPSNLPQGIPEIPADSLTMPASRVRADFVTDLVGRLRSFFRGEVVTFDDVDLDLDGFSPFQCALADELRRIPRGELVTYGELAALAGRPGAARAAGTFCARNRFAVLVPCHRVVAANGIGGYGSLGLDYKRRLLALEHVAL